MINAEPASGEIGLSDRPRRCRKIAFVVAKPRSALSATLLR